MSCCVTCEQQKQSARVLLGEPEPNFPALEHGRRVHTHPPRPAQAARAWTRHTMAQLSGRLKAMKFMKRKEEAVIREKLRTGEASYA